ncbi:hypothetical protein [Pelagibacterium sp. H642]|uniref:hypothetical protein n=1 Tax=Pelagibacterium sp. H642 TaxID=1881069 RepID=UPI002814EBF7|nr:hypothetical protein [Pelagibacterium sp. H642]WMT90118.1 hypothetical protein NO934_15165 [Pelagibacterium sp. H642]
MSSDGLRHISEALARVREHLRKLPADQLAVVENELDIVEANVASLAAESTSTPAQELEDA